MRVLVTGTSGFIRSHLVFQLRNSGHTVETLDVRPTPPAIACIAHERCDVVHAERVLDVVTDFAPEAILHLAARTDLHGAASLTEFHRAVCSSMQLVCPHGGVAKGDTDYNATTEYERSKVENGMHSARRGWCRRGMKAPAQCIRQVLNP